METRRSAARGRSLAALLLVAVLACGGSDPAEPPPTPRPPPTPGELVVVSGASGQTAAAGTEVANAPAVRLLSTTRQPMAGVTVSFSVSAGGGQLGVATARTDTDGVASPLSWRLGTTAGPNEVTATAGSLTARITATGRAGPAARLEAVGDAQAGEVGTALPAPAAVRVTDAHGNPVAGVPVTFTVAGGSVAATEATSDASGTASAGVWTLGTKPGPNTITVTTPGVELVVLSATGRTGAPARLQIVIGDGQTGEVGTALPVPPVVKVLDAHDNPIVGAQVAFTIITAGGSLAATAATSDTEGDASPGQWVLGPLAGMNSVYVAAAGVPGTTLNAQGLPGAPVSIELTGGGQSAVVGTNVPEAPTALVQDAFGNPLRGLTVRFSHAEGHSESGTDGQGRAHMGTWILGTTPGTHRLDATVVGTALSGHVTATALPGPAARIELVSGGDQEGTVGEPLARPIVVRIRDIYGNPGIGGSVSFSATSGGGSVHPAVAVADASGEAQTVWTLGPDEGYQSLRVRSPGTDASRSVAATAAPAPLEGVVALDANQSSACALKADGTISCWGDNNSRQLGDGTSFYRAAATPVVAPGLVFARLSTGLRFACALTSAGRAYCWGENNFGQLGDGTTTTRAVPTAVSGGHTFTAIAAGGLHVCALASDGYAWCWGTNGTREIHPTPQNHYETPARVDFTRFTSIVTGGNHTCGIGVDGHSYCWGLPVDGQLGNGDPGGSTGPHQVVGGHLFRQLTAGADFTCGLDAGGRAYCWGANGHGQLGDGTTTPRSAPVAVGTSHRFDSIHANMHTTCATSAGRAYCWGNNFNGQLGVGGDPSPDPSPLPREVVTPDGVAWRAVRPSNLTCGLTEQRTAYCWGGNGVGIGDGVTTSSTTPVQVRGR